MIIEDFIDYISKFITIEEVIFAVIGLILLVVVFILGGKEQEEK